MLSKNSSKEYVSNSNQIIKIIYLSEMAKHCYELHLENNPNNKKLKPTLVKQLQSVSNWLDDKFISGWMTGFKNTIEKHLKETISNNVDKLLITKKSIGKTNDLLNDDDNKEIPSYIKLYGIIYRYIKEVSLKTIGSTKHFKDIEYPSKKELTSLLNDLSSFFNNDIELTNVIIYDIWSNQK